MSVNVLAKKTVGFRSPYTGDTFQELTSKIIGRDGYMSGGIATDDAVNIIIDPVTFVQGGIVAETEVASPSIAVPSGDEPWFVLATIPDDDPVSGVIFSVTKDLLTASSSVVVAFKTSGAWQNPLSVDVRGASAKASEPGVESGTQPYFTLSGDNMSEIALNRGDVVDPDGVRRSLPRETASSAKNFSSPIIRAHASKGRLDYIVLRQRESHSPETKHIVGPLVDDGTYSNISKTGTRMGYYAKPGGSDNEQWFAYGTGTQLRVMGGPSGAGFADALLLTASGTVSDVWVAGQRALDDVIVLLYTDNALLRMVSFNASTGAQVDAPVTVDTDGNAITHVRAEMDSLETIHIVYERNDGGSPTQQVYYTRRSTGGGAFATAAVTHRIVRGSATGKNDTYPDISVDRLGNAHIVYTSGLVANLYGDLVYAVFDQAGNLSVDETHLVGSAVGIQASATDTIGFVATAYTSFQRARVAVNDFDEVFATLTGDSGSGFDENLLFSPGFSERLGFSIVGTGIIHADTVSSDIESNELGELRIAILSYVTGTIYTISEYGIDTVFAPGGLLGDSILRSTTVDTGAAVYVAGTDEDDIVLRRGTIGDIRLSRSRVSDGGCDVYEIGTSDDSSSAFKFTHHPRDLYLASFDVPAEATGVIPEEVIRVHNIRQKKMNYPFLVGLDGDFQGFDSVHEATRRANRLGGEIVVRQGDYRNLLAGPSLSTITLASGVSLQGEGQVVFEDIEFEFGSAPQTYSVTNIDGNIVERADSFGTALRAGDVVEMETSGFHRVLATLPPKGIYTGRLLLSESSPGDGAPVGVFLVPYPSGNRIENIALRGNFTTNLIRVNKSYQATLRNISMFGVFSGLATAEAILVGGAQHLLIENIDFTKLSGQPNTPIAIELVQTYRAIVRGCKGFIGEVSSIKLDESNDTPTIVSCTGMTVDSTGARTTPILVSGNYDDDTSGLDTGIEQFTMVGELIKSPPGKKILLQDVNTIAATGPLELTGATGAFDGATPQVITDSVNERIRAAGDAMTGNLTTDGTTQNFGATGVAGNRFNIFANTLDVLGGVTMKSDILTDGTTRSLGATGVAGNRFHVYASQLDVLGGVTMKSNILTDGTTRNLGATGVAGNRFDIYSNVLDALSNITARNGITLGGDLLVAVADADVPRIEVVPSTFIGVEYTLVSESLAISGVAHRVYVSSAGKMVNTVNAKYGNVSNNWTKDDDAAGAIALRLDSDVAVGMVVEHQSAGVDTWLDSTWTTQTLSVNATTMDGIMVAIGEMTGVTLATQISQLYAGVHGDEILLIPASASVGGTLNGDSRYTTVGVDAQFPLVLPVGKEVSLLKMFYSHDSASTGVGSFSIERLDPDGGAPVSVIGASNNLDGSSSAWTDDSIATLGPFTTLASKSYMINVVNNSGTLLVGHCEVTYKQAA